MAKFGWTEGKGLGASESGMTSALGVAKPVSTTSNKSKKNKKDNDPVAPSSALSSNIIDAGRAARLESQESTWGKPSRVVLLTNMVARDDVDDELGGEVADEAKKFGVPERCFVRLVERGQGGDDEGVRIFLVMSG